MLGLSCRRYASNVLFSTVDHDRSTSSSMSSTPSTLSDASAGDVVWSAPAAAPAPTLRSASAAAARCASRRAFSPLENREPRSGQFRDGSNGSHLDESARVPRHARNWEVLTRSCGSGKRKRHGRTRQIRAAADRPCRTCHWRRTPRICDTSVPRLTQERRQSPRRHVLWEVRERGSFPLVPLHVEPSRVEECVRNSEQELVQPCIL
jgi:hypothetical protein